MDFIVANKQLQEIGFLDSFKLMDFDIGVSNDFEITLDLDYWEENKIDFGYLIYSPNTEFGGFVEDIKVDTKDNTIKLKGYTWRGLLSQKIIEPPDGLAYLIVSGEANNILQEVIEGHLSNFFIVDDITTTFTINYQFNRYTTMLDGFKKMLETEGARLDIHFDNTDMKVHIKAVAIQDYSEELEYSQDNQINFDTRDYRRGINHLICLGSGELTEREVIHLYLQEDETIGEVKFYEGLEERVAVYDYSNAEDIQDLTNSGIERFNELINYKELSMSVEEIPAELGDIVGGRERITGLSLKQPITQKILNITDKEQIQFKVGE